MSEEKRTLEEMEKALAEAQALIEDQQARIKSLGTGREETMMALANTRDDLDRMTRERDKLQEHLNRVEGLQTATVAFPPEEEEKAEEAPAAEDPLPSIDELMADLSSIKEARGAEGHLHLKASAPAEEEGAPEMLSPALVFPEEFGEGGKGDKNSDATRVLVLVDGEQPIKFPLYKAEMTIGRIDAADIKIDSHYISRLHARVVSSEKGASIEDIDSKNGIRVNGKKAKSHTLEHGDLVNLGGVRLRFLDITGRGSS